MLHLTAARPNCVEAAQFSAKFLTINFKQRILLESVCLVGTTTW